MDLPIAVGEGVAERRQASARQPGHDVRQLLETGCAGDQRVEGGIAQQVQGERQPLGSGATPAAGRGYDADLAGTNAKSPGMERATEREVDLGIAVPTEIDDRAPVSY